MKDIKISFKMDLDFIAFIIVGGFIAYKVIENRDTFKYYISNKNDAPKEDEKADK